MPFRAKTIVGVALLLMLSAGEQCCAQNWHEDFETSQPSWRDIGGDARHRIVQQQRLTGDSHTGNGCEWLQLDTQNGTRIYFAHDIGRPAVIDDLAPSVWVRSDRPGIQLAVRIVLPRTINPQTGQPVTTIIVGDSYNNVGQWQQLRLTGIPQLLTRQVRVLRMQRGPQVDDHEAYVDALLLNVYSGPATSNVWIDDLDVAGHVAVQRGQPSPPRNDVVPVSSQTLPEGPLTPIRLPPLQSPTVMPTAPRRNVKLDGLILWVDGYPMLPRIIRHRGEPLKFLKDIGFNTVWLQRLPTPEVLEEASRLRLWLICPPPRPAPTTTTNEDGPSPDGSPAVAPMASIGPEFDCVLAWDLGDDLTGPDLEATQRWANQIHVADHRGNRPLICRPRTDLRSFSRPANLLLIDRRPLGTSLEMNEYSTWVHQQPLLASLGTPIWTTVQTQPNESLRQQLLALEPGYAPPLAVSPEQIRLLVYTAVASGSRGLVFLSETPLDAPDPETRQRAMTLELLNLELQLIEPWAAAGSFVDTNKSKNFPEVTSVLLRTDRASLLLPLWLSPRSQCVPSQSAANTVTLETSGVPVTSEAYEITPRGVQSIRHGLSPRGLAVTLNEFGLTTQILIAHDPTIVGDVRDRAKQIGRRSAELQRNLAAQKLNTVYAIARQLDSRTPVKSAASWFDTAQKELQLCDRQLAANDSQGAAQSAQRAGRSLRLIERAYWDAATGKLVSPITCPAATSFETLPCHWRFVDRLASSQFSRNRLDGGDFEDLGTMMRAGWRHIFHSSSTVKTAVDLIPQAAHGGWLGVRLVVAPVNLKEPPAVVETPPILFVSPAVQVEAGQIVCIHGWVQVLTDITASTDGLLIVDSFSGEALADRIGKTKGWREFAMYRIAPQSGPMCVTFAMSGIGEAWLDDVAIQVLEGPAVMTQR